MVIRLINVATPIYVFMNFLFLYSLESYLRSSFFIEEGSVSYLSLIVMFTLPMLFSIYGIFLSYQYGRKELKQWVQITIILFTIVGIGYSFYWFQNNAFLISFIPFATIYSTSFSLGYIVNLFSNNQDKEDNLNITDLG